ncbi:hypothetical protein HaLaN_26322, partial [Haematococcus lacustris]
MQRCNLLCLPENYQMKLGCSPCQACRAVSVQFRCMHALHIVHVQTCPAAAHHLTPAGSCCPLCTSCLVAYTLHGAECYPHAIESLPAV